uniref:Deacetylase sirtuin-type domain-containing protein n=1 Tax=Globodera rostochiensis TaxID=31243 RepID=A0A914HJT4_GLORO
MDGQSKGEGSAKTDNEAVRLAEVSTSSEAKAKSGGEEGLRSEEERRPSQSEPEAGRDGNDADGSSSLPNLYSKFVSSFESVIHNLVSEDDTASQPKQKLASLDLEGIASFIREEQPDIVFMVGAGLSTSAGIPDFRTPGTGLYDNLQQYDIPHPQAIFEINYFKRNPEPFFVLAKETFHDDIKPTPAHHFIRLVEEKGLLRRCFTQNIDALEYEAGVKDEKVVTAHGSYRTGTCLSCKKKYSQQWLRAQVNATKVPHCAVCKNGVVKPDIVFFGESLPSRFFSASLVDMPKCGLLIIMGTSLVVHPFASLVDEVPADTPRLLINLQPVGTNSLRYEEAENIRDVFWQGECDEGAKRLAKLLGWDQELKMLIKKSEDK